MMDMMEAVRRRHSVRAYLDRPIEGAVQRALVEALAVASRESGLDFRLHVEEPGAFDCLLSRMGKFSGVRNYITAVGPKNGPKSLSEACGYEGEKVVLLAQALGLNTCWVGLTCRRRPESLHLAADEKPYIVISVGYGATQGVPHRSRPRERVMRADPPVPDWFLAGVDAALLAPTAINQQKFLFTLMPDGRVSAKAGLGFYATMDLGIAKCHFEIGSGKDRSIWLPA